MTMREWPRPVTKRPVPSVPPVVGTIDVERLTLALWGMRWEGDASVMARKIAQAYHEAPRRDVMARPRGPWDHDRECPFAGTKTDHPGLCRDAIDFMDRRDRA